ncbi:MAG: hypothetical protein EOO39_10820 [Cytophagaceae bacterium]|nr:MAG: hypothetical protein EOO39_10820 [Cytophagaceae bacterium]
MESILLPYSQWIADWYVIEEIDTTNLSYRKAMITFTDGSTVAVFEKLHRRDNHFRYGYQWQTADDTLIIRWDNALHFPAIGTYPNHQHIGSETNVHESAFMTLDSVLQVIIGSLTSS